MVPEFECDVYPSRIDLNFQITRYKRMKLIMGNIRYQLKVKKQIPNQKVKTKLKTKKSKIT